MTRTEVFVLRYDMGGYGEGIVGVYSSQEKAEKEMASQKQMSLYTRYWIHEFYLDE